MSDYFIHFPFFKVTIAKKFDLILYFLLQAIILNISIDKYSIVGSVFLIAGNLVLMLHKVLKARSEQRKKLDQNI